LIFFFCGQGKKFILNLPHFQAHTNNQERKKSCSQSYTLLYIRQHGTYSTHQLKQIKTPCYVSFQPPNFKVLFTFPIFFNHRWTSKACMFVSCMTWDVETNSLKPLWKESGNFKLIYFLMLSYKLLFMSKVLKTFFLFHCFYPTCFEVSFLCL